MKAVAISALASGQGKTLFTMSLLHWLKTNTGSVRPFKIGPDYIDPRFHEVITGVDSVNLDLYMSSEDEVRNIFSYYSKDASCNVVEGVMGFYDGIDLGSSTYEVAKILNIPVILVIPAEGSYSTIVPILKGMIDYRHDNTIKGVIFNRISSDKHYELLVKNIEKEIPQLKPLGWIKDGLDVISSRHLGLDLTELENKKFQETSQAVMENINTQELLDFMEYKNNFNCEDYLADKTGKISQTCGNMTVTVVRDEAFSFVYKQNLDFLDRFFGKVHTISALKDEEIPPDTDIVYIPGGYVETPEVAPILERAAKFKKSLLAIANNPDKRIYAECAGLMFLGEKIQTTDGNCINGAGILPVDFEIQKRFYRLGYYKVMDKDSLDIYKGHAFHYSRPCQIKDDAIAKWGFFKDCGCKATIGAWTNRNGNVLGTYLHSFFYNQPELVLKYLCGQQA